MTTRVLWLGVAIAVGACTGGESPPALPDGDLPPPPPVDGEAPDPDGGGDGDCTVSATNISRSLVVTDVEVLARFPLTRVMTQLRLTAGVETTNRALWQAWMRTFGASNAPGDCDDPGVDPEGYGLACPRLPESKLAAIDPFAPGSAVTFRPVGLFNRLDLAPADGATCGEYRIVYAMRSTSTTLRGRAFVIFEAALPNPQPALGAQGCLPIARFWQGLTADQDVASRAAKLERFYFTGDALPGVAPVVHAEHYGLAGAGQVRTNFFVDDREWQLREFALRRACTDPADPATCTLRFAHVPVEANPAEELFAGTHPRSAAFAQAFAAQVPALARETVQTIAMDPGDVFDELESVSQTRAVVYADVAGPAVRDAVRARLAAMGSSLTVQNILDRATTQTCAGCHEVSNLVPLGGGLAWPPSLGFVQIDEAGALSDALRFRFLPHRKKTLEAFINASCTGRAAGPGAVDPTRTLGGSRVGAAN